MKLAAARAVEMTVAAKPCGFRPHLGNRCAIPTFPPPRRLLDCFLNSNPERSFPQPSAQASFRLILRLEKTPLSCLSVRCISRLAANGRLGGRNGPFFQFTGKPEQLQFGPADFELSVKVGCMLV